MQICCILFTSIGFYTSHTQQHSTNYYGVLNNWTDYSTYTNSLVLFIFLWPKFYGNSNWIFISKFHVRFLWTNCCAVCWCFGFHSMPYLTFSFAFQQSTHNCRQPHTLCGNKYAKGNSMRYACLCACTKRQDGKRNRILFNSLSVCLCM